MRKLRYNSFACTAFLWAFCFIGLGIIDGTDISYGRTCPDVLIFLANEADNHSNLTSEEQEQANDFDNLVEETLDEYCLIDENNVEGIFETSEKDLSNDDLVCENSNENDDLVEADKELAKTESNSDEEQNSEEFQENTVELLDESVELAFDSEDSFPTSETVLSIASEVDINSLNPETIDEDSKTEYADLVDSSKDVDVVVESRSVSEIEIDSLISEVESVSADLNETILEASEEGIIDNKESDENLDDESKDALENIADNNFFLEENEAVLTTEDSIEEIEESEQETVVEDELVDVAPVIVGDETDTIALPKEIEETIKEANALSEENEQSNSNDELSLKDNENVDVVVVSSEESRFNDAENLLSENSSVEELNPDAMEIEEINKEYGWETVESNTNVATNSSIGFDFNAPSKQLAGRRPNPKFGAQVDVGLNNEFWIVGNNGYDYYFWKYENNTWRSLSSEEFFATDDPGRTTIIWAHGYQTDMASATRSGVYLKSLIEKERQTLNQTKPYRLVVWKWDSERNMARIRIDAINKTALANCSGVSLGKFIGRFNPSDDVCLIGFSFGAQIVGSALQYLATSPNAYVQSFTDKEQSEGVATSGSANTGKSGVVSLVLISAACDSSAFNQGGAYALGATIPSSVLNVFNPYDSALHYYPFVSNVRAESLGVEAVTSEVFPNTQGKVVNFDVSGSVGRKHSFIDEIGSVPAETLTDFFLCD